MTQTSGWPAILFLFFRLMLLAGGIVSIWNVTQRSVDAKNHVRWFIVFVAMIIVAIEIGLIYLRFGYASTFANYVLAPSVALLILGLNFQLWRERYLYKIARRIIQQENQVAVVKREEVE